MRTLEQRLAAPAPNLLGGELLMNDRPQALHDIVACQMWMPGDAPPGQKDAQMLCPKMGSHSDEVAQVGDLCLAHLRCGATKIVVRCHCVNLYPFAFSHGAQLLAPLSGPVEWIAMGPLAINLHTVIAKSPGGFDQLRKGQRFTLVPDPQVSNAIESEFHFDRGCFSAAHTIALRKIVVKALFSKSQGP